MKRTIYIMISVTVACLCLNACDSWLDVDPSDQYSTETFWKTEEHASEDEIPHTHVLLAKRIFRVKLMVSPSLACRI